jgi:predicted RNase H-like HicB family nuclease
MFGWFGKKVEEQRQVSLRIEVPVAVRQEGGVYYSSCDVLDVHSQGRTEKEAMSNLLEALQLFVETCYEQGTLEQVLRAQGLHPGRADDVAVRGRTVEVPLALIAQRAAAHAH